MLNLEILIMKINSALLNILFLFLFTIIMVSCTSPEIEDEVSLEKENDEFVQKNSDGTVSLVDKENSDRPGSQGGN